MTTERSGAQTQEFGKGIRRRHSIQYKRQVVLESLKPGTSTREVRARALMKAVQALLACRRLILMDIARSWPGARQAGSGAIEAYRV